jgi:GT2 family glycosyltransferase
LIRTGVLVITHNSAGHIGPCLDALRGQEGVLVIDNASSDGTAAEVAGRAGVRFIQNERNAGFAGAVNQGFELFQNEANCVLLLNPDVILESPLDDLAAACERAGLAGGRLTGADGKTQVGFSFRGFPTPLTLFLETIGVNKLWKRNPVNRRYRCLDVDYGASGVVDQPAGAILMIRVDIWKRLKGFDETFYPVWFEDVDFCRRAAQAGFHAAYVPTVVGRHEGGHSVLQIPDSSRRRYWYASLLRYSRKHFGRAGWGLAAVGVAAAKLVRSAGMVLRLQSGLVREASMNGMTTQRAYVYPDVESAARTLKVEHSSNEGNPSTENTERTLKRLHAR